MRRLAKVGAALAVASAMVLATAGAADAKKVSHKKYAKVVCGAYSSAAKEIDAFSESYGAVPATDPVVLQQQVVQLTNDLVANLTTLKDKLAKVTPDVDKGKKLTKNFVADLQKIVDDISEALQKFQAADPNGVAFAADVTVFETALNLLDVRRLGNDPFREVEDQDLLAAFDKEKTCEDVVTVIGA